MSTDAIHNLKIAVSSAFLYRKSLEDNLRIAGKAGFEWTEFYLTGNLLDRKMEDLKSTIISSGLKVCSIHLPIPFTYNKEWPSLEDSIAKAIVWADDLSTDWIISHPLLVMPDADDDLRAEVKRRYKKILKRTSQLDNHDKLLIENMPNLKPGRPIRNLFSYPDEFRETLEEYGYLMTYDPSHWSSFDSDIVGGYRQFEPLVRNVHISDSINGIEHVVPGHGVLDLTSLLSELKETSYRWQVTLELDYTTRGRNDGRNEERIIEELRECREWMEGILD